MNGLPARRKLAHSAISTTSRRDRCALLDSRGFARGAEVGFARRRSCARLYRDTGRPRCPFQSTRWLCSFARSPAFRSTTCRPLRPEPRSHCPTKEVLARATWSNEPPLAGPRSRSACGSSWKAVASSSRECPREPAHRPDRREDEIVAVRRDGCGSRLELPLSGSSAQEHVPSCRGDGWLRRSRSPRSSSLTRRSRAQPGAHRRSRDL